MVDPFRLAQCIRRARLRRADEAIRRRLSRTRLNARLIERAFRLASLLPGAPVRHDRYTRGLLLAGHLLWASCLGFLFSLKIAVVRSQGLGPPPRAAAPAYRPEPLEAPAEIEAFLPEQRDCDAGSFYEKAGRLALSDYGRRLWARRRLEEGRHKASLLALEAGASCRGVEKPYASWTTESADGYSEHLTILTAASRLAEVFAQRADEQRRAGNLVSAEVEARRRLAFGYHLLQYWDVTTQRLGLEHAREAVDALKQIYAAQGRYDESMRRRLERLEAQCAAFAAQGTELRRILSLAREPKRLFELEFYLFDERLLRPYAGAALAAAASALSDSEKRTSQVGSERIEFLKQAALRTDPRLRPFAKLQLRALWDRQFSMESFISVFQEML